MYDFITHTWNPLAGACPHNCSYCSTGKMGRRYKALKEKYTGPPRLDQTQMNNLGKKNFIFVAAQNDLFAETVPDEIITKILQHCNEHQANRYFFQTRNTRRLHEFRNQLPEQSTVCTTIETDEWHPRMSTAPPPMARALFLKNIDHPKFVTIEPIMKFKLEGLVTLIGMTRAEQVNIGADSGKNNLPEPTPVEIWKLVKELEKFTKVKIKDNLKRLYPWTTTGNSTQKR